MAISSKLNNVNWHPLSLFYAHLILHTRTCAQNHFTRKSLHTNIKFVEPWKLQLLQLVNWWAYWLLYDWKRSILRHDIQPWSNRKQKGSNQNKLFWPSGSRSNRYSRYFKISWNLVQSVSHWVLPKTNWVLIKWGLCQNWRKSWSQNFVAVPEWIADIWLVCYPFITITLKGLSKWICIDNIDKLILQMYYLCKKSLKKLRQLKELHELYEKSEFAGGHHPKKASGNLLNHLLIST